MARAQGWGPRGSPGSRCTWATSRRPPWIRTSGQEIAPAHASQHSVCKQSALPFGSARTLCAPHRSQQKRLPSLASTAPPLLPSGSQIVGTNPLLKSGDSGTGPIRRADSGIARSSLQNCFLQCLHSTEDHNPFLGRAPLATLSVANTGSLQVPAMAQCFHTPATQLHVAPPAPGKRGLGRHANVHLRHNQGRRSARPQVLCHVHHSEAASVAKPADPVAVPAGTTAIGAVVMTDETVPEGHQGLHGFLYGDNGADVHDAAADEYVLRAGEDDGAVLMPLEEFEASRRGHKLAGVYAVYDSEGVLQYVGFARSILLSLKGHRTSPATSGLTHSVRVRVFRDPAMVTRSRLDEERQRWMQELCAAAGTASAVPPGNTSEAVHLWESRQGPTVAAMSESERAEYEEKKLKLRKAMGENLHDDVEGEDLDSKARRLALLQAVEGDDWSSVINQQTQATKAPETASTNGAANGAPGAAAAGVIVSPFEQGPPAAGAGKAAGAEKEEALVLEMNMANVDMVLNEVRPYLIADGGNVEVVAVDAASGTVDLQLQGACGTCPSATTTMKMGIERVLREKFGDRLVEVREIGNALSGGGPLTVAAVDAHLDMLRPAITNFKGSVEVLRVDSKAGVCEVKYSGPAAVGMGVQAAIKDKFPTLKTVTLVAP